MALPRALPFRRHRHAAGRRVAGAVRALLAGKRPWRMTAGAGQAAPASPAPEAPPGPPARSGGDEAWSRFQASLAAGG
jgi:hypothetical protein